MPPPWSWVVSWVSRGVAFGCAAPILHDLFARGYRQHMRIMEAVWPITAPYFDPLALWAYFRWGRPQSPKWTEERGGVAPQKGFAASVAVGDSHCGAGCMLAHKTGHKGGHVTSHGSPRG